MNWRLLSGLLALAMTPLSSHAGTHRLKVVTSFLPIYCFTANITGGVADVENLLPPGAEPHDFQFTPREARKLESADVVIINGLGLESWLDRMIRSAQKPKSVVEAAYGFQDEIIRGLPSLQGVSSRAGEDAVSQLPNPHVWLDPKLAAQEVSNIVSALAKADTANADVYQRNGAAFVLRLQKLDDEISAKLSPFRGKSIITYHDAFPYFARCYGLKVVGVVERVEDVEPSARYLSELNHVIQRDDVKVLFAERQSPLKLAEQIGHDYHVTIAQLDTLETGDLNPEAYETGMRKNLEVLEKYLK